MLIRYVIYNGNLNKEIVMTYYITAYTNDKARLIVSESRTTADKEIVELIKIALEMRGYYVTISAK
jgi:hypothetical protein